MGPYPKNDRYEAHHRVNESLGPVVKSWRDLRRMSMSQLVKSIEAEADSPSRINRSYISHVERGRIKNPGEEKLEHLAYGLRIPVEYLHFRLLPKDVYSMQYERVE